MKHDRVCSNKVKCLYPLKYTEVRRVSPKAVTPFIYDSDNKGEPRSYDSGIHSCLVLDR